MNDYITPATIRAASPAELDKLFPAWRDVAQDILRGGKQALTAQTDSEQPAQSRAE